MEFFARGVLVVSEVTIACVFQRQIIVADMHVPKDGAAVKR